MTMLLLPTCPSILIRDLNINLNSVVVALLFPLCLVAQLAFWLPFLYRQRPTLSHVPGPRLARWSRLWIAKALASGRSHEIWTEVNAKYGSVARIGPNHIVIDDPEITRRILAARSGYVRGPWFDSVRIDPHIPNIVSERDVRKHAAIRAKLAPSFTGKSVAAMEPVIDHLLANWIDTLKKRFTQQSSPLCDIGEKIQFLTVDIITKLCLGDEIGCVKNDRDMHDILGTVEIGNRACQYFSVFLELNTMFFQLARIPFLRRALFPKPSDKTGVGRLMGTVHSVVHTRQTTGPRPDVVTSLLARGMSAAQIDSELIIALVAGSDTTSTSAQATLLAIITNPQVYATLRAEISRAVASGAVSSPVIQDCEAKQLAYLQACVMEGLRKFPPLSQLRERVVPAGGDTLGAYHVPGGTYVGLNAWGTQLTRGVYGEDAEVFRPERWLIDDAERLRGMYRTHGLIFGHGATKCLGASMAVMEVTKVVFEVVRNFEVAVGNPYRPWVSRCYGIFFQKEFWVRLREVGQGVGEGEELPGYEEAVRSRR